MSFSSTRTDSGSRYNPLSVDAEGRGAGLEDGGALTGPLAARKVAQQIRCIGGSGLCMMMLVVVIGLLGLSEVESIGGLIAAASNTSGTAAAGAAGGAALSAAAPPAAVSAAAAAAAATASGAAGGNNKFATLTAGMLRHDGFFTMFTDNTSAPTQVFFAIEEGQLEAPFLVSALRQRADGFSHSTTLHYPLEQSLWQWSRSPGNEADPAARGADASTALDLGKPQLAVRASATEPVRGAQADGIWEGWGQTLPVAAVNSSDTFPPQPLMHLVDVTRLLTTEFLTSVVPGGVGLLARKTTPVRIVSAKAFPLNNEFEIEFMSKDSNGAVVGTSVHLTILALPKTPLLGRVSDDRVGYFETSFVQLGLDDASGQWNKLVKLCNRWRLEKRDPQCERDCEPRRPITYHVDPSVPPRWRQAVKKAVENWRGTRTMLERV